MKNRTEIFGDATLPLGTIVKGDALEVLRGWPAESVQCVVTSPPYWGLRDYGEPGQGGLEETPEAHVAWIVGVFREVRRVLRRDGTVWLNYGDCFAANRPYQVTDNKHRAVGNNGSSTVPTGLKPKDLVMMPARVAIALQADGWWIRQDVIWAKPNPMPESVTDRPATSHEHVFLLTRAAHYFYDADAVREEGTSGPSDIRKMEEGLERIGGKHKDLDDPMNKASAATNIGRKRAVGDPSGRNLRSVWTIPTQPYPGAHFATFPERLVEPCIKAGTSERGACPACGAPWKREVERTGHENGREPSHQPGRNGNGTKTDSTGWAPTSRSTGQWAPTCECPVAEPVPCVVLDPFAGSGTAGMVAHRLGRYFVGIDLAGGDKDMGGHTAHDRLEAGRTGRTMIEEAGARIHEQGDLLEIPGVTP